MTAELFSTEAFATKAPGPTAEEIYQAFPRKQGKIDAIAAIKKAMKREDPAHLLERTKAFAIAVDRWPADEKPRFIPHPATWFNRGSYDDDPQTWQRKNTGKGRASFA